MLMVYWRARTAERCGRWAGLVWKGDLTAHEACPSRQDTDREGPSMEHLGKQEAAILSYSSVATVYGRCTRTASTNDARTLRASRLEQLQHSFIRSTAFVL